MIQLNPKNKTTLTIRIKQLGRKKPAIDKKTIEVKNLPKQPILSDLIKSIVIQQVQAFNQRTEKNSLVPFLLNDEIKNQSIGGKVGFGSIYNTNKAKEKEAIQNALLSFTDGIYCVFIDEDEIEEIDQPIQLTPNSIITFVRLTFLSGSIW